MDPLILFLTKNVSYMYFLKVQVKEWSTTIVFESQAEALAYGLEYGKAFPESYVTLIHFPQTSVATATTHCLSNVGMECSDAVLD
jgi:hypothetical protein